MRAAFARRGVVRPWRHQALAAATAIAGRHVVIATGTASGKSLCYQLPITTCLTGDDRATALYLAPTKALAADQLRAVGELELPGLRAAGCDGDTPRAERDWARAHARWLFTNPDMLHHRLLPSHDRWARFLRGLRYVVIDECHAYRGVFGSHVALLLRRLTRVARRYGATPTFILTSATVAEAARSASTLTGVDCAAVTEDGSPRGARTIALWEPPLLTETTGEHGAPVRRSAGAEAARILAELVIDGARSLAFVRSRRSAELTAMHAREILSTVDPTLAERVAAYRSGYLPEDRRVLEKSLLNGELLAVAATNALELGVDIAGLDAVVVAGFPGTLASFWQQAGRAGRAGGEALVILVARDDPLDTYMVHHPDSVFGRPVEATVLDPDNPYVLAPQLACAAAELPLTESCVRSLGGPPALEVASDLVRDGLLRVRPTGLYWTDPQRPHASVDIRGSGDGQVMIVESDTARVLGTVNRGSACSSVHPGAVHLHRGESYLVDELNLDEGIALVHAARPNWTTSALEEVDISVRQVVEEIRYPAGVSVGLGEVAVTSRVVGFLRKFPSGAVVDRVRLDLPEHTLVTRAVWYTIAAELLCGGSDRITGASAPGAPARVDGPVDAGLDPKRVPGALHAAEHAAIGLLPLFATCDRWDIGGVSTAWHEDTGEATVFVHDGHPGGAGFADRGHAALVPWLAATREAVVSCECPAGCPSCVQSPKCGNGNEPLDKAGAVAVLDVVLRVISPD